MPRKPKFDTAGLLVHVCDHEAEGRRLYLDVADHLAKRELIVEAKERFGVQVVAYVEMDTHDHSLVLDREGRLSEYMQYVKGRYAARCNRMRGEQGALHRRRYWWEAVTTERRLQNCVRYFALNPFAAEMVTRPQDHRWSSYSSVSHGREDAVLDREAFIPLFGGTATTARGNLIAAVEEAVRCGVEAPKRLPPHVLDTARPPLAQILARREPRAAALLADHHGYRPTQIAEALGVARSTVRTWLRHSEGV